MPKHHLLRAASAAALIAAMGTAAFSQTGGSGQSGPSGPGGPPAQTQQPSDRAPDAARPDGQRGEQRGEQPRPDKQAPRASDRTQDKAAPKSSAGEGKGEDQRRTTGERERDGKDRPRQTGERPKDTKDSKDSQRRSEEPTKDRTKSATEREQKDGARARPRQSRTDDRGAGERVRLSEQQRTSVRERLTERAKRNRITNVNFDIRVGARVPRSVTLVALPADIIQIVPEYRGYQYVYAGDAILIVDSDYEVVAVLGSDSRTVQRPGGRLTISSDDRVFIRQHIDRGFSIRLGIGGINLGMRLPADVELRPLPVTIAERVPDLRDHSYFVYEDEVVIVDPGTREVVLVIDN